MLDKKGDIGILVLVFAVALIIGGGGVWFFLNQGAKTQEQTPTQEPKPTVTTGIEKTAKGTLSKQGTQYVISGDPVFKYGLYIKNSFDPKVSAILEPLVGQQVEVQGSVAQEGSGDIDILWVNGKTINP